MMDLKSQFDKKFWNEDFWLPNGVTWDQLKNTKTKTYGQPTDLWIIIPITVVIFCLRIFVEKCVMKPIGTRLNLPDNPHKPPKNNIILEKVFRSITQRPNEKQLKGLCKQLDWSEQEVLRWFRRKNLCGRPTTLRKFSETGWRFVFYICSFVYGVYVLYDEECVWNSDKCWADFPGNHFLSTKLYWYYIIELGFYTSTTATQFFDIKRKDFWEMFIHHLATILLLAGSYVMNFTKMGSFIIVVHDSADFYLEFAKMAKYAERKQITNIAFISFAITFFLSRLAVLPVLILPALWSGGLPMFLPFSVLHCLYPLLLILQVLHFYWGYHVAGGVYASIMIGNIERDTRSDTEEEAGNDSDEFEENYQLNNKQVATGDAGHKNGVHAPNNKKK